MQTVKWSEKLDVVSNNFWGIVEDKNFGWQIGWWKEQESDSYKYWDGVAKWNWDMNIDLSDLRLGPCEMGAMWDGKPWLNHSYQQGIWWWWRKETRTVCQRYNKNPRLNTGCHIPAICMFVLCCLICFLLTFACLHWNVKCHNQSVRLDFIGCVCFHCEIMYYCWHVTGALGSTGSLFK